ncbi:MAG: GGDEF domain-containing protein [Lachnospiraceae bacterium]|jgi:diguanylate cyclase (GGDEF)-like protein
MKRKLELFLFNRLLNRTIVSDDGKYLFLISNVACIFALAMMLILFIFYFLIKVLPLLLICLFSVFIYILLFRLVNKGNYLLFGILLSGTVIVVTLASTVYIGGQSLVILYLFVTLVMQIIIPYSNMRIRTMVVIILWLSMVAHIGIGYHITPICEIGSANGVLAVFNMHLAFWGIGIQLTIGNIIRNAITEYNRAELEKRKNEANTDPLTGLFNRRYADTFFELLRTGQIEQNWCVAMLDIDFFKRVNDTYGHQVGDKVLMFIGDFIKARLRRTDLVFRWGGEEFLILLKDADIFTAFNILDKLRAALEFENIEIDGNNLNITATIGVCPLDIDNVDKSIDTCDQLMYEGKTSGRNRVVV